MEEHRIICMKKDTYLIKATPKQVDWLTFATNQAMRIHIGQLTDPLTVLLNFELAYPRHHEGKLCPQEVEERLEKLSRMCWDGTTTGYAYSEKSRALWDLYQLFKPQVGQSGTQTFTVDRDQLLRLREATKQASRLRVGQTRESMLDELLAAYHRTHAKRNPDTPKDWEIRRAITEELDELHRLCWDMSTHACYDLGYDACSDGCWSMYEAIRHLLWKEEHPNPTALDRLSVSACPPIILGDQPLINITRI